MSTVQPSTASQVFKLMDLPEELRLIVYGHAASPDCAEYADHMGMLNFTDGSYDWCFPLRDIRLPAFALTNKDVCRDFLKEYFKTRVFRVEITIDLIAGWTRPDLSPELKAWLKRLEDCPWLKFEDKDGREYSPCRFRHLNFRVREAVNTMSAASINATINADYVGKSILKYHTSLVFDESFDRPYKEGRDRVDAAYKLFCATLEEFTKINGVGKPGLSMTQLEVLLRCIDVNPDTREQYLDKDFMNWDEEPGYEVEDWREQGREMGWIDEGIPSRYEDREGVKAKVQ